MCLGCYAEFGAPRLATDATQAGSRAIGLVFSEDFMGGALHVVIDDWNIEDESLASCAPQTQAERACHAALSALSLAERASALALYSGYLLPDGSWAEGVAEALAQAEDEDA